MDLNLYEQEEKDSSVRYTRRLDRTPDKHFKTFAASDKARVSSLRNALEGTRSRIVRLRDDNDEKDFVIEEERTLRIAAEENLQKHLVDLYGNPNVNAELHSRLPLAKKVQPGFHLQETTINNTQISNFNDDKNTVRTSSKGIHVEKQVREMSGTAEENDIAGTSEVAVGDDTPQVLTGGSCGSVEDVFHPAYCNPSHKSAKLRSEAEVIKTQHIYRRLGESSNSPVPKPSQTWPTVMSVSHLLPPYIHPYVYMTPVSPAGWSSPESSVYQDLPRVQRHQADEHNNQTQSEQRSGEQGLESSVHKSAPALSTTATQTTPQDFHAQSSLPLHEALNQFPTHSASLPSLPNLGILDPSCTALPQPLFHHSYAHHGVDNVSHISRLLIEIATLKKENEDLKQQVKGARNEKLLPKTESQNTEDLNLDKVGALIEEVRAAEKKRELALKLLMNSEDESETVPSEGTHHRKTRLVSKSVQTAGVSDSELSEVEDFNEELAENSESSMDYGGGSLKRKQHKHEYLEKLLSRQREIMKDEMQIVLNERNDARQRVAKLEKKLTALELSQYTDKRADSLLAKLRVTEKERDVAVAKLKNLTQEINETKLMYSLHKALLSDDPTNYTSSYPETKTSNIDVTKKNLVNSALPTETEEMAKLKAKLALVEKEKQSQTQHIEDLQQLVRRQRQKLNILCAGPMLMEND